MRRPNVLLIVSDQHQWKKAGCYGHRIVRTPNLDRLAEEGVTFDRAFCANPLCVPARVSLLTGRYSVHNGVYGLSNTFRDDMPTYAHLFAASGFRTALAGRMHLVWNDNRHGFEERLNDEPYASPFTDNDAPWWKPVRNKTLAGGIERSGPNESRPWRVDSEAVASALEFIDSTPRAERPWMLTSCFYQPHTPYDAPREYWDLYDGKDLDLPEDSLRDDFRPEPMYAMPHRFQGMAESRPSPEGVRRAVTGYYGSVTCMDAMIGRMLDALERTGQLDNTVIIYNSDHGEMLGEKGCWHKSVLYNCSAQVPFIVRAPGRCREGARVAAPVSHVDLFPTMAALLGLRLPEELRLDGRDLTPLLTRADPGPEWDRRGVLVEYADYGVRYPMAAWLRGRHKLTCAPGFPPVLNDLDEDPDENVNLAEYPGSADVLQSLQDELAEVWDPEAVERSVLDSQMGLRLVFQGMAAQNALLGLQPRHRESAWFEPFDGSPG